MRLPVQFVLCLLLLLSVSPAFSQADFTLTIRHTMMMTPSRPNEDSPTVVTSAYSTHLSQIRRDALDRNGNITFTQISDCGKRAGLILDPSVREYRALKLPRVFSDQEMHSNVQQHPGDAVLIESRTVDTGEKKVFFGFAARHFITTVERPVKNGVGGFETIDGWYIEHAHPDCRNADGLPGEFSGAILVTYPELPDVHHIGPVPRGLAVEVSDTIKWTGGKYGATGQTLDSHRVVETLSDSSVDPKMFEIPSGFRENPNLLKSARH